VQYRLLEATRIYASEKLAAGGDKPETARRHADHHLKLIETAPGDWESDAGKAWLRLHGGRIDDVRAALDWCFSNAGDLSIGLRLIIASARLWFQLSLTLECRDRIEAALRFVLGRPELDAAMEMRLQTALGYALWYSASEADRLERAFAELWRWPMRWATYQCICRHSGGYGLRGARAASIARRSNLRKNTWHLLGSLVTRPRGCWVAGSWG
jgi:hypothetical protein